MPDDAMTHPKDLFAGYVDGTLSNEERAEVEAHLTSCAACRLEVRLAAGARSALVSLPEEPVPLGVTDRVLDEAAGGRRERATAPRARLTERGYRVLALAAAAVVVLVVAVVALPGLLGDGGDEVALEAGGAPAEDARDFTEFVGGPLYVREDIDLDAASVQPLAEAFAAGATRSVQAPAAEGGEIADAPKSVDAISCIAQGSQEDLGPPVKLIDASYEGTPAHVGVFLEGPDTGRAPEAVVVWIVARDDCRILSFAEQRL